jgi:hypothetical protein
MRYSISKTSSVLAVLVLGLGSWERPPRPMPTIMVHWHRQRSHRTAS